MTTLACPTDVFDAPAARVWELITNPARFEEWADSKPVGDVREVREGDRVVLKTNVVFKVVFEFLQMNPPRELALDVRLPFGLINHEVIRISPIGESQCRVTFN